MLWALSENPWGSGGNQTGQTVYAVRYFEGALLMTLSAKEVHELKHAPVAEGVLPAIRERWSPRAFAER